MRFIYRKLILHACEIGTGKLLSYASNIHLCISATCYARKSLYYLGTLQPLTHFSKTFSAFRSMSSKRKSPPSKLQEGNQQSVTSYNSVVDNNNSGDKIKNYIKEEEETDEQETEESLKVVDEHLCKGNFHLLSIVHTIICKFPFFFFLREIKCVLHLKSFP